MKLTAYGTNGRAENAANLAGMVRGSVPDQLMSMLIMVVATALGTARRTDPATRENARVGLLVQNIATPSVTLHGTCFQHIYMYLILSKKNCFLRHLQARHWGRFWGH